MMSNLAENVADFRRAGSVSILIFAMLRLIVLTVEMGVKTLGILRQVI